MAVFVLCLFMRGSRGGNGTGVRALLENNKATEILSNTGPDPLGNHKATKPVFTVGPSSGRRWINEVFLAGQ